MTIELLKYRVDTRVLKLFITSLPGTLVGAADEESMAGLAEGLSFFECPGGDFVPQHHASRSTQVSGDVLSELAALSGAAAHLLSGGTDLIRVVPSECAIVSFPYLRADRGPAGVEHPPRRYNDSPTATSIASTPRVN
jgi:hypothetical protein